MMTPMLAPDERSQFWTGFRFDDLNGRTMHAIEEAERVNGLVDMDDSVWLQLASAEIAILRARLSIRSVNEAEVTDMLIQLESTIARWRDNRRRRYWQAHGCAHELPSWARDEGPDRCPWCGITFSDTVQATYEEIVP